MSEDTEIVGDVRAWLGDALDGPEPPHLPLAEGSIARGDRARRRNRVLGGAGAATLGIATLVGTMAIGQGGGPATPAQRGYGPPFKLVSQPQVMENQYDMVRNMAAVVNPLLPKGLSVRWNTAVRGISMDRDAGFGLFGPTGADGVFFSTVTAESGATVPAMGCDTTLKAPGGSPTPDDCETTPVPGGTVTTHTMIANKDGHWQCQAWYRFEPADASYQFEMDLACNKPVAAMQLSPAQFADLVQKPGFGEVVAMADIKKPATTAGKRARSDLDAAIKAAIGRELPAGYALRLPTTNLLGNTELVAPSGVVLAGAEWQVDGPGMSPAESCLAAGPDNTGCLKKKVPGGTLYEGHADAPELGRRTSYAFVPDGAGVKEIWVGFNSEKNPYPITPDQFLAIAEAPGARQAIITMNSALSAAQSK